MSFGQWASDYLGVPLEERFNFNPLTYFLYSGIDGAWFDPEDMSTMFQDAAGTIPVTAMEQPVGLWLDKSQGLLLGPELVANGVFDVDTAGWEASPSVSTEIAAVSGELVVTNVTNVVANQANYNLLSSVQTGRCYIVSVYARKGTSDGYRIIVDGSTITFGGSPIKTNTTNEKSTLIFKMLAGQSCTLKMRTIGVGAAYFDNISVREIKGNHATQSITASRPTLSARYNLLTKTEDFTNNAWLKSSLTPSAGLLTATSTTTECYLRQATQQTINSTFTAAIEAKQNTSKWLRIRNLAATCEAWFDLETGQIGINTGLGTPLMDYIGGGYYMCSLVINTSGTIPVQALDFAVTTSNGSRACTVGDSIYIRKPKLTFGSSSIPYQRVNTATDYDTVGFKKYIKFDGVDDYLNLPYMGLYANGSASVVAATTVTTQNSNSRFLSEGSATTGMNYSIIRYLPSGPTDSVIVNDTGTTIADTSGVPYASSLCRILSIVDSGSIISSFRNSTAIESYSYARSGALSLSNTTIGAMVLSAVSDYVTTNSYGIVITKSALSDADRRRCEQFLASRLTSLGVTLS